MAPSPDGLIVAGCRAAGFEPNVIILTRDPLASRAIAAAGLAVSLTPQLLSRVELPGIVMPPLEEGPAAPHALRAHARRRRPPARRRAARCAHRRRARVSVNVTAAGYPAAIDVDVYAATTAPPRRGSPPPANAPVAGSCSTAWQPPKKRFSSRNQATVYPAASSAAPSMPGSA